MSAHLLCLLVEVAQPRPLELAPAAPSIAACLPATTDLPLSQVARRCGFSSGESLRQAFVAKVGVSPRTFRQTHARSLTDSAG